MASTHQKYVWGGNRKAVQVQSKLTTRKVGPFYTGERKGSRSKKAEVVWIIPLAHGGRTMKLCSLDARSGGQSRPPPKDGGGKGEARSTGAVEPTAGILPIESGKRIAEAAWTVLCARRAPTINRWSLAARTEGQSGEGIKCKVNDPGSATHYLAFVILLRVAVGPFHRILCFILLELRDHCTVQINP